MATQWEHIVRNELELNRIREYIGNNPTKWDLDTLNTHHRGGPVCPPDMEIREPRAKYATEAWMI
jgi:putative transposase